MEIFYLSKFFREYKKCSPEIKLLAKEKENILKCSPFDPILKTHKLRGKFVGFWAFSINFHYRIIFEFKTDDCIVFHSIGDHSIYE